MSFQGAGDPRDGPRGPAARGREPRTHELGVTNILAKRVFIGSGPGPVGRSGMTNFPTASHAGRQILDKVSVYL